MSCYTWVQCCKTPSRVDDEIRNFQGNKFGDKNKSAHDTNMHIYISPIQIPNLHPKTLIMHIRIGQHNRIVIQVVLVFRVKFHFDLLKFRMYD